MLVLFIAEDMASERIQTVTMDQGTAGSFQPLVVIQFSSTAKQAAIEWLVAKLQATRATGGAELEVTAVVMHHTKVLTNPYISILIKSDLWLIKVKKQIKK